ncbi:TonB-dependent receptor [Massilia sp. BJB1822]|uniref:TonB-dependent receptor n=1 Tax=Massilia sp. BJB1822 TaxID=2744470 RepID=UPI0015945B1F|nr:TonB-dependent receptor [Massilia sp. BJB1822]NVD97791.1 TonB-dependent receptor [Massilia sp. BJB1822]
MQRFAFASLAILPPLALAQQAGDSLSTVVITAQKRSEALQQAPLSVTALTDAQLEQMGVHTLADVARQAPGLNVVSSGPGQNILIIRGVSSTAGTAGTVGYYLDDTPISASSNASLLSLRGLIDPSLFDLARVEVLRGPQGTLYGSSSMGGTVRYVTRQPDMRRTGVKASVTLSETDGGWNREGNAVLNLPLMENRLAGRLAVFYRREAGYIDRYPIDPNNYLGIAPSGQKQEDVNTEKTTGFRAMLKLRLDNQLDISGSLFKQKMRLGAPFQIDAPPGGKGALIQTRLMPEPSVQDSTLGNLTLRKGFANGELVATSSYYHREVQVAEDASKVFYYFLSPDPQTYVYPLLMTGRYINREWTQEVRYASDWSGPFQLIAGAFYHKVNAPLASSIPVTPGYNEAFGTDIGTFFDGARQATVSERAWFAEGSYRFLPAWTARVGLRAFRISQTFAQQGDGFLNGGPSSVVSDSRDKGYNPKFNLSWQIDRDLLLYATAAKGYRQGGPNNPAPANVCGKEVAGLGLSDSALVRFGADTLWNYELGLKSEWPQQRLTVNGALYYIDWNKVQQQIVLDCGFNITVNFGSAKSKGGELEIAYRPTTQLTLRATGNYTSATLDDDVPGTGAHRGDALLDVPRWNGSISADYNWPLRTGLQANARIDTSYSGSADTLYEPDSPFRRRGGYALSNLRFTLENKSQHWIAAFFVNNLFNRYGQTGLPVAISADLPATRRLAITRPRTVGVSLSYVY